MLDGRKLIRFCSLLSASELRRDSITPRVDATLTTYAHSRAQEEGSYHSLCVEWDGFGVNVYCVCLHSCEQGSTSRCVVSLLSTASKTHGDNIVGVHFESAHAILGLITYILLFAQGTVGMLQFYFPSVYGGEAKAKAIVSFFIIYGHTFRRLTTTYVSVRYLV